MRTSGTNKIVVVIVGPSRSGKTQLLNRFIKKTFDPEYVIRDTAFSTLRISVNAQRVELEIWIIKKKEDPIPYADVIFVCQDENENSDYTLPPGYPNSVIKFNVITKCQKISRELTENKWPTNAERGENIDELFQAAALKVLNKRKAEAESSSALNQSLSNSSLSASLITTDTPISSMFNTSVEAKEPNLSDTLNTIHAKILELDGHISGGIFGGKCVKIKQKGQTKSYRLPHGAANMLIKLADKGQLGEQQLLDYCISQAEEAIKRGAGTCFFNKRLPETTRFYEFIQNLKNQVVFTAPKP